MSDACPHCRCPDRCLRWPAFCEAAASGDPVVLKHICDRSANGPPAVVRIGRTGPPASVAVDYGNAPTGFRPCCR